MGAQLFVQTPEEYQAWLKEQQAVASNDTSDKTIAAANPANKSSSEFLAPYAQDMGISSKTLEQLHSAPEHMAQHLAITNQL
jgi:cytochrome c oxidase subunit 2